MSDVRYLPREMNKNEKPGKCPWSNETGSVASMGTPRLPADCPSYSTFNCFKDEGYVPDTGVMKLHIAARENNTNAIKKSLDKGVSVSLQDATGRSALHWAAIFCKLETVEAILSRFPAIWLDMGDRNGRTPLHYAVLAGRADVTNMLLKAGCHVHSIDNHGRTPLHYAAQNANASVVSLLLRRGADPSYLDLMRRSPYDVAKGYHNTSRVLECLGSVRYGTPPEAEKPKLTESQHKQPTMKRKTVEADGRVSITFYSTTNTDAKQTKQSWGTYVPETEEEPVEFVKEVMERDAERMKYKLHKIETRKEPPSEEKLKEQERALQQLLDRSKKNATQARKKSFAEAERLRRLSEERTRSETSNAWSIPLSSLGMTTLTISTVRPFQTLQKPSHASSPGCEEDDLTQSARGQWHEGTSAPWKVHRMATHPQAVAAAELGTQFDEAEKSIEGRAVEHAAQRADTTVKDSQPATSVQQERAEPEGAAAPPSYLRAYVHQWFANAFPYPDESTSASVPDEDTGTPVLSVSLPPQNEEVRNIVNNRCFTASSGIRVENESQGNPLSPESILYNSSYKSSASPQPDTNRPQSSMCLCDGTKPSTAPSIPLGRKIEPNVRHNSLSSVPDVGQKETEIRTGFRDVQTLVKRKDRGSYPNKANKNLDISSDGVRLHPRTDSFNTHEKLLQKNVSTGQKSEEENGDPFTRQGYAYSFFKAQKKRPRNKSQHPFVVATPNRHGLECFSRPKARKTKEVRRAADQRWQYNHRPLQQPWSPDEPWRPGGISRTVVDFKMTGLLKAQCKKYSGNWIRSMYHVMKSKHVDDDIDSDPFANDKPHDDEEIHRLPLGKIVHQQEALWSLRSPDKSDHDETPETPNSKARSTHEEQEGSNISSLGTSNLYSVLLAPSYPPAEIGSEANTKSVMTCGIEQGEGMLMAEMTKVNLRPSNLDKSSQQRQLNSFSQTNPHQTKFPSPQRSLQPSQLGLQYASFIRQDRQLIHENTSSYCDPQTKCSLSTQANQQQQEFEPPTAMIFHPPYSCLSHHLRHVNSEDMSVYDSQQESCRPDDFENGASETYGLKGDQQSVTGSRSVRGWSSRRCLMQRTSPERLALLGYYGQSVRPQFLGLHRAPAPVHQCIDVETLVKQWV